VKSFGRANGIFCTEVFLATLNLDLKQSSYYVK
jgi:hypothetical protein